MLNRLLLLDVRLAASSRFLRSMEALISAARLAASEEERELDDLDELLDELRDGALEQMSQTNRSQTKGFAVHPVP